MDIIFNSRLQEKLIKKIPFFKGSWLLFSVLLKFLPKKLRFCQLKDSNIKLDLTDPAQFSIVKTRKGRHEIGAVNFIKKYLPINGTFIDIGANFGYFTSIASKLVGNGGCIFSFEPNVSAFNQLLNTIKRNQLFNVFPFNIAINDKKSMIRMEKRWFRQNTSSYMVSGNTCLSNTFDSFLESILTNRNISIIKIDVEGAEWQVINGMKGALRKNNPFLIIEPDDNSQKRYGNNFTEVMSLLESMGYKPIFCLESIGSGMILDYKKEIKYCPIVFGRHS